MSVYCAVCFLFLALTSATSAAVAIGNNSASSCYTVNSQNHCFYTNGSLLSRSEAREFCESVNSTLPIITDENIDAVFQQFIVNDANTVIQDNYVWLDAHARRVYVNKPRHWIDGTESGLFVFLVT